MTRLTQLFEQKPNHLLNIYFTAGFPQLHDTEPIILAIEEAGADMIEIGMPYSDPLADGPTIQQSGMAAIENGMTLQILFEQVRSVRQKTQIPLILMGYFNQVMQFGEELFLQTCAEVGIDALILPDMPLEVFETQFQPLFEKYNLDIAFLITPQTPEARIRKVDALSKGFIYMVADASITGSKSGISEAQIAYFERINALGLKNPRMIGFGISDKIAFQTVCKYANGAIIGSAFIKAVGVSKDVKKTSIDFVSSILS